MSLRKFSFEKVKINLKLKTLFNSNFMQSGLFNSKLYLKQNESKLIEFDELKCLKELSNWIHIKINKYNNESLFNKYFLKLDAKFVNYSFFANIRALYLKAVVWMPAKYRNLLQNAKRKMHNNSATCMPIHHKAIITSLYEYLIESKVWWNSVH